MSTFGTLYKVHTYGESHCKSVGAIVDGIPPVSSPSLSMTPLIPKSRLEIAHPSLASLDPLVVQGLELTEEDIQVQLSRRRPGQSDITTPVRAGLRSALPRPKSLSLTLCLFSSQRNEFDLVRIQSGVEHGVTLGTPIGLIVLNKDQRPHDYAETDLYPRPSHADWTYLAKYGVKASSGGGRSSARETIGKYQPLCYIHRWRQRQVEARLLRLELTNCPPSFPPSFPGRVAAGAIAEKYLKIAHGIEIVAFVSSVGKIHLPAFSTATGQEEDDEPLSKEYVQLLNTVTREEVDKEMVRCPNREIAQSMEDVS
jgi:chorismate synthase